MKTTNRRSISCPAIIQLIAIASLLWNGRLVAQPDLQVTDEEPPYKAELFEPGRISTDLYERDASFHPNGEELYFTLWTGRSGVIMISRRKGDGWDQPQTVPFSGRFSDLEPFVTPDGGRLLFASTRPMDGGTDPTDYDLWYVERDGGGWGEPKPLTGLNTKANEFYPSVDRSGTIYWTAAYENAVGGEDIFFAVSTDSGYSEPMNAGSGVNTERDEFNALIAPDGSWLAFGSFGREDGSGGGDLYISFRQEDGSLGIAINMGPEINSPALDFCPSLTPDGSQFLFSSRRMTLDLPSAGVWTYDELARALRSPGNGNSDLYVIDAGVIEQLRERSLK